jgi:hypothetical protein
VGNFGAIYGYKNEATRQMHVYVYAGHTRVIGPNGRWKTLGVAFTAPLEDATEIVAVSDVGSPTTSTGNAATGGFFQTTDLEGGTFPNGHAATVTFAEGTDMSTVQIDLTSFNTYLVQREDHDCVPVENQPCGSLPSLYFYVPEGTAGYGFVVFTDTNELWAFAQTNEVSQISIQFCSETSTCADGWVVDVTGFSWQAITNPYSFGIWDGSGGPVSTGTRLATITPTPGACVGPCVDVNAANSNMENVVPFGTPKLLYSVVYVYDAPVPTFYNPCATCADPTCQPDGAGGCSLGGTTCYPSVACSCDGVGFAIVAGPSSLLAGLVATCLPDAAGLTGAGCTVSTFPCFSGTNPCASAGCYIAPS